MAVRRDRHPVCEGLRRDVCSGGLDDDALPDVLPDARMVSASPSAWRVSSQRRWIRASFTSKRSAKSASTLREITHSAGSRE